MEEDTTDMGHFGFGFTEAIIFLVVALKYAIPIAVAIWIIKILVNIRAGQEAIKTRLQGIERAILSNPPQ